MAGAQRALANGAKEVSRIVECPTSVCVWIKNASSYAKLISNELYGSLKVGVVRQYDRLFAILVKDVNQQVGRDVYIRTLFLGLDNFDCSGPLIGGYAKGILTVLVKKWPKWIEKFGIVPNALR